MSTIAKLNGVTWTSVAKRNGIAVASIAKIDGVDKPAGGVTYLLEEDFESVSTGTGWTDSGSPTWGYSPALVGSYSIAFDATTDYSYKTLVNSEHYGYCIVDAPSLANFPYVVNAYDSSGNAIFRLRVLSTGAIRVYNGTIYSDSATGVVTTGTTHCWWYYKKGTGADGLATVWASTTATKPGSAAVTKTDGDSQRDVQTIRLHPQASTTVIRLDKLRIASTEIGSNPT